MNQITPAVVSFLLLILPGLASAQSIQISYAQAVEVLGPAMLLGSGPSRFGSSCSSRDIRMLPPLRRVRIGDEIKIGTYPFRVGVIKVSRTRGVLRPDRAGAEHIECVLVEKENLLGNECGPLMVEINSCLPVGER